MRNARRGVARRIAAGDRRRRGTLCRRLDAFCDAWALALRSVTGGAALRDRLRLRGLDRATHFSWDESAARHLALFRDVAARPA